MSRVAITDYTFESLDIEKQVLEPLGLTVDGAQCSTPSQLIEFLQDADYVITQFAPVDETVIKAMQKARVIVRYGIGVDNVDLVAAQQQDIPVCNVPEYCIDEVADHTLALILASTRQVVANANHVAQGNWGLATPVPAMTALKGQTVGVVGFGRIGREVISRLLPFKCKVLVSDPAVDAEAIHEAGAQPVELDQLLATSDLITLHCPAIPATQHLIRSDTIQQMKPGAVLVNVARGAIVCTSDLIAALESGRLGFAALDVLEAEPPATDDPVRTTPNTLIHSHVASVSEASAEKLRTDAAMIVAAAVQGKPLPNIVNGVTA
ncbi:MAG: C-terminal binding protein [Pirellulales bacterium]|nr:C-terminal binding protein [Pirellulales bacterium]